MLESPGWSSSHHYSTPEWRSQFNWTMTYRRDSDVKLLYGSITKNTHTSSDSPILLSHTRDGNIKHSKHGVAWIASNCGVGSKRDAYVKELEKHIQVDKYGRCGNLTCQKDWVGQDQGCMGMIDKQYKFYLSLENSFCQDYVTEKFFKILPLDVIPIVRGGAIYSDFAPHKWYINTDEFKTPHDLANYLKILEADQEKYSSYFKYRDRYTSNAYFGIKDLPSWCDLCEKLNDVTEDVKEYDDITRWWNERNCRAATDV